MKKSLAIILALLCIVLASACGNSHSFTPNTTELTVSETPIELTPVGYTELLYPFSGDYTVKNLARQGYTILILAENTNFYSLGLVEYRKGESGRLKISETKQVSADDISYDNDIVIDITAGMDGFYYVLSGADTDSVLRDYTVHQYSEDGSPTGKVRIESLDCNSIRKVHVDASGNILLRDSSKVFIFSAGGELRNTIQPAGNGIISSASANDGVILSIFTGTMDSSPYFWIAPQSGEMIQLELDNPYEFGSYEYIALYTGSLATCQGLNGEFIISTGDSFLLCDFSDNAVTELLSAISFEGQPLSIGSSCRLDDDSFAFISSGGLYITGTEYVEVVDCSVVRVALVGVHDDQVLSRINSSDRCYSYEATTYSEKETQRFLADLISGESYDLVLFNNAVNTNSEYFEDLFPYIDSDPGLNRDMFLPNLLESTSVNGQLHQLSDCVCITTLIARADDVRGHGSLSTADYSRIIEQREDIKSAFGTYMSRNNLLIWISELGSIFCVDKHNAVAAFDTVGFRTLLEWCRQMGDDIIEGSDAPYYEASEVLLFPYSISRPEYFEDIKNYIGGELSFVGFPAGNEGISYYEIPYGTGLTMAIPVNSTNKEGAWSFIRDKISFDNQINLQAVDGIPVNYSALQYIAEATVDPGDRDLLYRLIDSTHYAENFSDDGLRDIIKLNSQAYLAGDKSLDETIAIVQSKASIYVAEQYG